MSTLEVLGYDCDGKPLRAGDRVVVVVVTNKNLTYLLGQQFEVVGACPVFDGAVEFSAKDPRPNSQFTYISGLPEHLRKIDQTELGDWNEIARSTKWHPTKQADPETTA